MRPSPALSILKNGPASFAGRKVGVLVSPRADAALLKKHLAAIKKEGAVMDVIAPKVGGVEAFDGSWVRSPRFGYRVDAVPEVLTCQVFADQLHLSLLTFLRLTFSAKLIDSRN